MGIEDRVKKRKSEMRSVTSVVREHYELFDDAIKNGVTHEGLIVDIGEEFGIKVPLATFRSALQRVRKERIEAADQGSVPNNGMTNRESECNTSGNRNSDNKKSNPSRKSGMAKANAFMDRQQKKDGWT